MPNKNLLMVKYKTVLLSFFYDNSASQIIFANNYR